MAQAAELSALPATASRPLRSAGAILAGLLAIVILSSAVDAVLHATGTFPPPGKPMSTGLFILATSYRAVIQIGGGYLTARLAPREAEAHVLGLGAIGVVASLIGLLATMGAGPDCGPVWYPLALLVLAVPTVWIGGKARAREDAHAS